MKIESNYNYAIITNDINEELLDKFKEYTIIDTNISFADLKEKIYNYPSKTICFNDCLRNFTNKEKEEILESLVLRKVNYINITSNIEEVLFSDYLSVYYDNEEVMFGPTIEVLKNEKILKRLGFALPFAIDMSKQLMLYDTLKEIKTTIPDLLEALWN